MASEGRSKVDEAKVGKAEVGKIELGALLDFYSELLTAHQKEILEVYCNEDMSLFELAEQEGVSRQGIHDTVTRGKKLLVNAENKLHLLQIYTGFQAGQAKLRDALESQPFDKAEATRALDELCAIWEENKE